MRRVLAGVLLVYSLSFANELYIQKTGYSTYVQEEEFMVAEGENVIGPITLLPIAITEGISIVNNNLKIKSFVIEGDNKDWKKALKGQVISIEGEGRFIKGEVVDIKNNRIMLNTRKGYVVTTLPEFPSKISSYLSWNELFSPKITFKISAKEAKTEKFKLKYPIKGLNWDVGYVLDTKDGKKQLKGFIKIINRTPLTLKDINLKLIDNGKVVKTFENTSIPAFSKKEVVFIEGNINKIDKSKLISGKVVVYENGIFKGFKKIEKGVLK